MPIEPMGPVVVGVDGSAESFAALDLAGDEAAWRATPLVVLHAWPGPSGPAVVPACAPEWIYAPDARRRLLWSAVARVGSVHPDLTVRTELVTGEPAETLVARSAGACLVVVGHHVGGRPSDRVALRVATHAEAPVLVRRPLERPDPARSPQPVLVGVDGPTGSGAAVEFAFAEAAMRDAPLVAMYVWSQPAGAQPAGIHPSSYGYADARDEAQRMLAEALAGWSSKYPDVPVRREVRHSLDIPASLRDASAAAQLVVVGRCRHSGFTRLLLGSISRVLVQRAGCPVAVIP